MTPAGVQCERLRALVPLIPYACVHRGFREKALASARTASDLHVYRMTTI